MTRHPIGARGAEIRSSGVRVDRADGDVGVAEARRHFGGVGIVGAVLALAAGWLGGTVGARYHRRADSLVARTRDGGVLGDQTPHLESVGGRGRVDLAGGRETGASTRRAR